MTLEALERMSRSGNRDERLRAARIAARHDAAETEELVLRLLRDPNDVAVTAAMATALLEVRREAAIPLILRSLGQDLPAESDERFDEAGQLLLESLLDSELDGVVVRETILAVMLEQRGSAPAARRARRDRVDRAERGLPGAACGARARGGAGRRRG